MKYIILIVLILFLPYCKIQLKANTITFEPDNPQAQDKEDFDVECKPKYVGFKKKYEVGIECRTNFNRIDDYDPIELGAL